MKSYSVIIILLFLVLNSASAKLRNGYEVDIQYAREKLRNYNHILSANNKLSASDKRKMKNSIKDLMAIEFYYELTDELMKQFKLISPGLYDRVDAITDAKGRPTDVYVKFIPREEALVMAGGITRMSRSDEERDACYSEYGKHTVSIKVWIFNKALFALAHELGHVSYQVPNIETYTDYYKGMYRPYTTESNHMGHAGTDGSGKSASAFEKEFTRAYRNYFKHRHPGTTLDSPLVLVEEIKRKANNVRY
jgi:hypothetical protein